jgi:hypothetical protein
LGISNASIAFWYRITMEEKTWKHITLGELYRGGVAKFRRGRRALKHYSPLKLDLTAAQNLWGVVAPHLMAPILYVLEGFRDDRLLPHAKQDCDEPLFEETPTVVKKRKPWHRRTEQVQQSLLRAWDLGYRTYAQLIEQVRVLTGKGCSKRAVSRFIKERREL